LAVVARVVRAVAAVAEGLLQADPLPQAGLLLRAVHLQQMPAHKAGRVGKLVGAPRRRKVDRRLLQHGSSYWYSKVRL